MLYNRIYIILLAFFFAACSKDKTESVFGEKPEDRMAQALQEYKTALTGSANGWKTAVYPEDGGGYSFYFKFGANDRVTMQSDINLDAAAESMESSYRLKAVQRPSLLFDTYSYLHLLADPDPNVFGGVTGLGYSIDFEYSIDTVTTDTIKLTGIANNTRMILVRATAAEAAAYTAGSLATLINNAGSYIFSNPWLYLEFSDGIRLQVGINPTTKNFSLVYVDGSGQVQTLTTSFSYTINGIQLKTPVTYNGNTFSELLWDPVKSVFYVTIGDQRVEVKVAASAVVPAHRLLGIEFDGLIVLPQPLPGSSPAYATISANLASSLINGPYGLTLYYTAYVFNVAQQTMDLNIYIVQNNNQYLARYPFTYTKTADGVFNFTGQAFAGNASLIAADAKPLLDYIRNDRFTLDFFNDPQEGKLGQLKSIEHPDFYFTGYPQ
ncbi:DUF4302 domain-containing protein [Chitinophaga rhizophila]|uniref:DUF4302 domain-containing protein n=1 Tax=Chitinophaga rhizophila TaxID=2866212 RepID=A0ABS7GJC3_9BACT|nr:DUF4302 domain-containing protein [Chitinophaga rhizophila]MBW8686762.1 DUF4302 domain-containing protein [Chitinophaga rhizophila]